MPKRDWTKARRNSQPLGKPRASKPGRKASTAIGAYDNYLAKKRRIREENDRLLREDTGRDVVRQGVWPAYVTDGMKPDGTLRVLVFANREEADAKGFQWVGRT